MEEHAKLIQEIKDDIAKIAKNQISSFKIENDKEIKVIKQDFTKVNEKLKELNGNSDALAEIKESIKDLNEVLKTQAEAIEEIKTETVNIETEDDFTKVIKQAMVSAGFNFRLDSEGKEIVSKGTAGLHKFGMGVDAGVEKQQLKAAHVMGRADVTGNAIPIDFSTMGKDIIPVNTNDHVSDFYPVKTTEQATVLTLLIEYDLEGAIDTVDEGDDAGLISIKLKSKNFTIFEAAVMATISWRETNDVPELMDALKRIVPDQLKQMFDAKILTTGGDNSAEPWGCMNAENGTVFNALEYTGLFGANANIIDMIVCMKNQAKTADYSANGIFMGDKRALSIAGIKDTSNNNLADRRLNFNSDGDLTKIAGLVKKESRLLPDTLLVSVTNMNQIGIRKNLGVTVGFNADDLRKRRVSTVWDVLWAYGSKNVNANIFTSGIEVDLAILKETPAESLARINGYAVGSDAAEMTIQMMINAGGTEVIPENLAAYKDAIAAETGIASVAALQVVIDAVNAA